VVAHSKDCYITVSRDSDDAWRDGHDASLSGRPSESWYGFVLPRTCNDQDDDPDRERIVIFSVYKGTDIGTGPVLINSTALFCTPSVRIQQSVVTIDQAGNLKSVDQGTSINAPNNLTALAISKAVLNTVEPLDYVGIRTELAQYYDTDSSILEIDNFFGLILMSSETKNVKDLRDGSMMAHGAQKIFKSIAVQLAKQYFLNATSTIASTELEGTAEYKQQRLFVRSLSLRAVESILCVLVVVCMYSALRRRHHTTPQDPASIARLSSIISQSRNLNTMMSSTGFLSLKHLESLLSGRYSAAFSKNAHGIVNKAPRFVIESHNVDIPKPVPIVAECWQPLSTQWYFRLALLFVPLSLIVVLEITFRQSQRDSGLLNVATNRWTQYGSEFVPALSK
jgi:hypothetical protein